MDLYGPASSYLSDIIKVKQKSSCSLHSNNGLPLDVSQETMYLTLGSKSFTFGGLALWNSHLADLCVVTPFKVFLKAN